MAKRSKSKAPGKNKSADIEGDDPYDEKEYEDH